MNLREYNEIAPKGFIQCIQKLAQPLKGKRILHINSTKTGGGVAEILHRFIPLFQELDIDARWEVIQGDPNFFRITKCMHNALQGMDITLSKEDFEYYLKVNRQHGAQMNFNADIVIIHDPQPLPLIEHRKQGTPWIWRCHIDLSKPNPNSWRVCEPWVSMYDGAIVSSPLFSRNIDPPEFIIPPSIDPLSEKNCELTKEQISQTLHELNISLEKPIVLQVSRFDWFKDPLGVIEAYKIVKEYEPCQLLLVGGPAKDDPEAETVYNLALQKAGTGEDIKVLMLPPDSHLAINALQRASSVVVQKSLKEGFGLTVSEALWKKKAVVGGFVGGIPMQILSGVTGFTVHSVEGCAYRIRQLLANQEQAKKIGGKGKELVRQRFLITRHLADYLTLMHRFCL